MVGFGVLLILLILLILAGSVCGIIAVFRLAEMKRRIEHLERQAGISRQVERPASIAESPRTQARKPVDVPPSQPAAAKHEWSSLEVTIGAKWLNWVGVLLVIAGVMFFLKYAYDNDWIGPAGRIAIGAIAGVAALIGGE